MYAPVWQTMLVITIAVFLWENRANKTVLLTIAVLVIGIPIIYYNLSNWREMVLIVAALIIVGIGIVVAQNLTLSGWCVLALAVFYFGDSYINPPYVPQLSRERLQLLETRSANAERRMEEEQRNPNYALQTHPQWVQELAARRRQQSNP